MNQFARMWRAAKKSVYSPSLADVSTANSTIEHVCNPETLQKMVMESEKDCSIGGPQLAAEAIRAGLVDEYHQCIAPLLLGNGTYWLPENVETKLELLSLQKFDNGVVHLHYNKVCIPSRVPDGEG